MAQRHWRWLLLLLFLAALLRLAFLGSKSLWLDEALSIAFSTLPQAKIWAFTTGSARPETHPPLYYSALHIWMQIAGRSETAVRLPSALISLINVGLLYWLGRRLVGKEVGLMAAGLLAVAPLNIWYAQEARMYVFMTSIGLLAALLLTWQSWWSLPLLTAVLTIGLYLDYTLLPYWVALSAVWLVWWWGNGRSHKPFLIWLLATLAAWLLFQPWLPQFYAVLEIFYDIHIFEQLNLLFGIPILTTGQYLLLMVVAGVLMAAFVAFGWRLLQRPRWRRVIMVIVLAGFAVATLLIPIPRFYGIKRLIVAGWPFVILFVAWLLTLLSTRRRVIWGGLMGLSLAAGLTVLLFVPKDDWRALTAYLNQHADEVGQGVVWIDPPWDQIPYSYYKPLIPPQSPPRENETNKLQNVAETAVADIWLISERSPGTPIPASGGERWLDQNRELVETIPFYRLQLRRYR